ncbi:hypothetical protein QO010_000694 [Caulobacter ginsengisoli]|uniref:CENP-V/GFA domain-containing protein n=1 Tax=Caulobacter ginsengisoli TaxID=400775 RepID=A0ABU0ING4_9CAUL|nr:hypothetical protein [Caulobacter ginsengisoli]MDQ0462946.1 hypothetical protein [Caulobacter ginsengisoli]
MPVPARPVTNLRDHAVRRIDASSQFVPTLAHGEMPGKHIRATCACGLSVVVDISGWAEMGLHNLPLTSFEDRLRCMCGRRSIPLFLHHGSCDEAAARTGGIYVWR